MDRRGLRPGRRRAGSAHRPAAGQGAHPPVPDHGPVDLAGTERGRPGADPPGPDAGPDRDRARRAASSCAPARRATRDPIVCLAGPPGCGKTALARLIAGALRRPAVTIALGGVWDESAIRGLAISFRSPEAGRIVRGLLDAKVRNP